MFLVCNTGVHGATRPVGRRRYLMCFLCVIQAFMERLGLWGEGAMFSSFDVFLSRFSMLMHDTDVAILSVRPLCCDIR